MTFNRNNQANYEYLHYLNKNILHYDELNIENIEYSPFKSNNVKSNVKNISASYYSNIYHFTDIDEKRENLKFTTDYIKIKKLDKNDKDIYYITFDLNDNTKLCSFIENIENKVKKDIKNVINISHIQSEIIDDNQLHNPPTDIQTLTENSVMNEETLSQYTFYKNQSILYNKDLKCKVGNLEDLFVYDYNLNLIDNPNRIQELINKNIYVRANLTCVGLWIYKKQYGLTWLCSQIQFNKNGMYVPKFISDIEESENENE
jgi:hypothetical protein